MKRSSDFLSKQRLDLIITRILSSLHKQSERAGDYTTAKTMRLKFEEFSRAEQQRQEQNMKMAQEKELMNIEEAQRFQFQEFTEAWDKYMRDYEVTAFELIEQLKVKQEQERIEEENKIARNYIAKQTGSKELSEMRKQEKIYFSVKDYDKAQAMRMMIE